MSTIQVFEKFLCVQYFSVMLFMILYKVALAPEFVKETQKCDHSDESY